MMTILLSMSISMSIMFMVMSHPLSAGMMILSQTIIISLITGNMNQNFWFSYILFLILIGGMLILFMYMTSIASNEKFKMNLKTIMMMLPTPLIMLMINSMTKNKIMNNEIIEFYKPMNMNFSLNKYINLPLSMTLLFLMLYLLLALIATVKITSFKEGSIRQMS